MLRVEYQGRPHGPIPKHCLSVFYLSIAVREWLVTMLGSTPVARLTTSGCSALEDAAPPSPVTPRTEKPVLWYLHRPLQHWQNPSLAIQQPPKVKLWSSCQARQGQNEWPKLCYLAIFWGEERAEESWWEGQECYCRLAVQGQTA